MKVYELIESSPGNTQSKALCVSLEKAKEVAEELFEHLKRYLTGVERGPDFIGRFEKELIWHNTSFRKEAVEAYFAEVSRFIILEREVLS